MRAPTMHRRPALRLWVSGLVRPIGSREHRLEPGLARLRSIAQPVAGEAGVVVEVEADQAGHRHWLGILPAETQDMPFARRRRHLQPALSHDAMVGEPAVQDETLAFLLDPRRAAIGRPTVGTATDGDIVADDEIEWGAVVHPCGVSERRHD